MVSSVLQSVTGMILKNLAGSNSVCQFLSISYFASIDRL